MKKVATVAVAAVLAATAAGTLAGCGSNESEIRIHLLANTRESEFYQQYFQELEQKLQDEGLDYTISFTYGQEESYYNTLQADLQGGELPDIFYVRPNEILEYKDLITPLQDYADGTGKQYANLDNIYDMALDMYRYNPSTGELGNHNDPLYAFPKDLSVQQLGYNRKELEPYTQRIQALKNSKGESMKMPWNMDFTKENYTWEDYKLICKTIADNCESGHYACDIPSVEVLAHSFGGELIDFTGGRQNAKINSLTEGAVQKAIKYQAELVDCGAANYVGATYQNMTAGRVCFYGIIGSWEISEYNTYLGEGNWEVMPWPTEDGETDWQGVITSAGYVVSKECAESAKGDVAKRIAISFMSDEMQERLVKTEQISLPLRKSVAEDYRKRDEENDELYSLASRGVFLDVISGEHGFIPAKYQAYDSTWMTTLNDVLDEMWTAGKGKALTVFGTADWAGTQTEMQTRYDRTKNR